MSVDWTVPDPKVSRIVCEDEVTSLVVTPLYIVCQHWVQPEISVYSRSSFELEKLLEGHEYGGQCLESNQDGILFSASLDRSLRSWDLNEGKCLDQVSDHADYVQCLGFNNPWVATGGQGDKKIFVYMVDTFGKLRMKYKLCGHTGWVKRIAILGNTLVSGGLDSTVRIWDLWTGHQTRSYPVFSPVMSLDLINLNLALFGGKEGEVSLLDLQSGQSSIVIPSIKYSMDRFRKALKFHQGSVDSLKYSQDEKLVITGGEDRQVRLWNIIKSEESFRLSEFQEIDTIREHCEYINSVCVHENTIFSSSGDVNVLIHEYPWREGYGPKPSKQPLVHQQEQDSEVMKVEFEKFLALVGECKAVAEKETELCHVSSEDLTGKTESNVDELSTERCEEANEASSTGEDSSRSDTNSREEKKVRRKRKKWLIDKNQVEIHEELGRGKFGIAFRGTYKNMTVAVKVSNPFVGDEYSLMEDGIIKEVGRFCRCRHPSLVQYYGVVANKEELNFWIVTEFLTGHTLLKLIQEPEVKSLYNLRRRDRLAISEDLASGMEYLHDHNIIHGDLTAWNIFVSNADDNHKFVKITDFGLSTFCRVDLNATARNELFIPPEILLNHQVWDDKADVWCLGAILLEFNLESYMWDSHCIEKAKLNYVDSVEKQEPIRFGLKIRWSSFEFLWDCLSYKSEHRPKAADLADGFQLLICQNTKTIRELPLTDDMIFWLSKQTSLLANWQPLASKLGVNSIVPIVRDVVSISGDRVSVVLEAWKVKYSKEANCSRLIAAIQGLQLQGVVDDFYREFQISKSKRKYSREKT